MQNKQYNVENEILKKRYEEYLSLDGKLCNKTIYTKIKAIRKYEEFTKFKSFKTFNKKQALEFRDYLQSKDNSLDTIYRVFEELKQFFIWCARQNGYKKSINLDNIKCFNLTGKENRIVNQAQIKRFPTLEQIYKIIENMPSKTIKEKRDRAIIAFAILTGARIEALMTFKIKTINEYKCYAEQNPKDGVRTKRSKYIITGFFPINEKIKEICLDWLKFMKEEKLRNGYDFLFPAFKTEIEHFEFKRNILSKDGMNSETTVRNIFREAFNNAGIEYYNPHSFRDTLVDLGYKICKTPEEFKAWSQNLGHKSPLVTFNSYGTIEYTRQVDVISKFHYNTQNILHKVVNN